MGAGQRAGLGARRTQSPLGSPAEVPVPSAASALWRRRSRHVRSGRRRSTHTPAGGSGSAALDLLAAGQRRQDRRQNRQQAGKAGGCWARTERGVARRGGKERRRRASRPLTPRPGPARGTARRAWQGLAGKLGLAAARVTGTATPALHDDHSRPAAATVQQAPLLAVQMENCVAAAPRREKGRHPTRRGADQAGHCHSQPQRRDASRAGTLWS